MANTTPLPISMRVKAMQEEASFGKFGLFGKIYVAIGWDPAPRSSAAPFDLDLFILPLDANERASDDRYLVCPMQRTSPKAEVRMLTEDNQTGEGASGEDDEAARINLDRIPSWCEKIIVGATIVEGVRRKQTFGDIPNAYIHLVEEEGDAAAHFRLTDRVPNARTVTFARLVRDRWRGWLPEVVGKGDPYELKPFLKQFGVTVEG